MSSAVQFCWCMTDDFSSSSSSNVLHLKTKLTQTKTGNKSNGGKKGDSDKTIHGTNDVGSTFG